MALRYAIRVFLPTLSDIITKKVKYRYEVTHIIDPIITSSIHIGVITLMIFPDFPNSSTISPKRKTKDGRPTPVIMAVKYPRIIKSLSTPSA